MQSKSSNSLIKTLLFIMALLLAVIFIALSYSDGTKFPNWKTLLEGKPDATDINADYFRVIDVGQGDCLYFYSNGCSAMIDSGIYQNASNLCFDLKKYGVKTLNAVMLTHMHNDHTGALDYISQNFDIAKLIIPVDFKAYGDEDADISEVYNKVLRENGKIYSAVQGTVINVGDFEITVLGQYTDCEIENDRSVVMMAKIDNTKILLCADAERATENRLLAEGINLDCDILKVGHHGSNSSSTERFLEACSPKYAAISCGTDNQYGHPHDTVLERLENKGAQVYRTDIDGDITFNFSKDEIKVDTEK